VSKTIALRAELKRVLKTLTGHVYGEKAPEKAPYPHAVFELSEVLSSDGKTIFQFEVNIIDYGLSETAAETLSDTIQEAFNKYSFINAEIQFTSYKGLRQTIKEDDHRIIRRRLLFEIQLHELKGE